LSRASGPGIMRDPMPPIALSKTRLLSYLQCPKRLWLAQYSPELENEDAIDQAAIETGRVVGAMARKIYGAGDGRLVNQNRGLRAAVAETAALLDAGGREPIFEATFDHDGLTVQVDVLDRSGSAPRIVEVKSSTTVKEHHVPDCAIQAWTLRQLGIEPEATVLALIDNEFEYAGDGNYDGLFREIDLTPDLDAAMKSLPGIVAGARETLDSLDEPEREIGPHCQKPYPCPFFEHCAPAQGEFPILDLGGRRDALYALMREGFTDIRQLDAERLTSASQQRIRQQALTGEPYVAAELEPLIEALPFPRHFLDFETIAFAIPIWSGTRPYEALPFQWSCHVDDGGDDVVQREFLDLSGAAPMRRAAETLIEALGTEGPVIVYTSYEKRVLRSLAERYADLAGPLEAIVERLVDLHPIAKTHYYHPDMHGSWSIKAILPTIDAGIDYSRLDEVRDGEAAQSAYLEAIHEETPAERREALREALLAYCRLDTLALVKLVEFFGRASP
jgi:predicted RecB family nuclease